MDPLYHSFTGYIRSVTTSGQLGDFKSNSNVTYVLEHVGRDLGQQYYDAIKTHSPLSESQIKSYCQLNDRHGGGMKCDYGWITTSPSNFRYLFQSHLILSHMKRLGLSSYKIAEVGCGYGGLCLALTELASLYGVTLSEYHLIDLPDIGALQQLYLSQFSLKGDIAPSFHSAYEYGKDITSSDMFLISNYCFSEIGDEHQKGYRMNLFPRVSYGFMIWNHIALYDFGFHVTVEAEYPMTSFNVEPEFNNKYVYF